MNLPWMVRQQGQLADGSIQTFDVYGGVVEWDGQIRNVQVEAADAQPLVGTALLYGFELRIQMTNGGIVEIMALP